MLITFIFDCGFAWFGTVFIAYTLSNFTQAPFIWIFIAVQSVSAIKAMTGVLLVRKGGWIKRIVAK